MLARLIWLYSVMNSIHSPLCGATYSEVNDANEMRYCNGCCCCSGLHTVTSVPSWQVLSTDYQRCAVLECWVRVSPRFLIKDPLPRSYHYAILDPQEDAEIAGVEIVAPHCRGGNHGRRKSMEREGFRNVFLTILTENRVMILACLAHRRCSV